MGPPILEQGAQNLGSQGSVTFLLEGRRLGAGGWCSCPNLAILFLGDHGQLSHLLQTLVYLPVQWGVCGPGNICQIPVLTDGTVGITVFPCLP